MVDHHQNPVTLQDRYHLGEEGRHWWFKEEHREHVHHGGGTFPVKISGEAFEDHIQHGEDHRERLKVDGDGADHQQQDLDGSGAGRGHVRCQDGEQGVQGGQEAVVTKPGGHQFTPAVRLLIEVLKCTSYLCYIYVSIYFRLHC